MAAPCTHYRPRNPQSTILHQVVSQNWEKFVSHVYETNKYLPAYVEKEFSAYLACGQLDRGFVRLKCNDCKFERLLPFSCKRRGFCPSCCGRRMNEAELKIVEEIFPQENARQWVLSLPMPARFFCSRNKKLINTFVSIFHQTICRLIRRKLKVDQVKGAKPGGIVFIQRLGGALNLNVHFHAIFLDGGYSVSKDDGKINYHELADNLTPEDIEWAVTTIAKRAYKELAKQDLIDEESNAREPDDPDGIDLCDGASVRNMIAFGERAGKKVRRLTLVTDPEGKVAVSKGHLVAELNGFNLKADKLIKSHQRWKLSRLVRYVARPPLATDRLTKSDDGQTIRYAMKRPWSDGTTQIVLSNIELIEKLAAAVPPPRGHLVRYVGALGPNSKIRAQIVPLPKPKARDENGKLNASATARATWAVLMKRAFQFDLKQCPACGGEVRPIAVIMESEAIRSILDHIARPPPLKEAIGLQ